MLVFVVTTDRNDLPIWSHCAAERDERATSCQHLLGEWEYQTYKSLAVCFRITHCLSLRYSSRLAFWEQRMCFNEKDRNRPRNQLEKAADRRRLFILRRLPSMIA